MILEEVFFSILLYLAFLALQGHDVHSSAADHQHSGDSLQADVDGTPPGQVPIDMDFADIAVHDVGDGPGVDVLMDGVLQLLLQVLVAIDQILGQGVGVGLSLEQTVAFHGSLIIEAGLATGVVAGSTGVQNSSPQVGVIVNIGDSVADEVPLVDQDLGHQAVGAGALHSADLGEGGHQAAHTGIELVGVVLVSLESVLVSTQLDLTGSLLGHVGGHAAALSFLVVEGEVLGSGNQAVLQSADSEFHSGNAGQDGILGVVLTVTAVVSVTVGIQAGAPQDVDACEQGLFTNELTQLEVQLGVEGGSAQGSRAEHLGVPVAIGVSGGDSPGSIGGLGSSQVDGDTVTGVLSHVDFDSADGLSTGDGGATEGEVVHGLFQGHLIQQIVPLGIGVDQTLHVGDVDAVVLAPNDGGAVIGLLNVVVLTVQMIDQSLAGQGHVVVLLGIGAGPVLTGQVDNLTGLVVVPVGVGQLVGDSITGLGDGECLEGNDGLVNDQLVSLLGVAIVVHAVSDGLALGSQDVVQSVVSAVTNSEVVVACVKDVGLLAGLVEGGQVLQVDGDLNGLGSTGSDDAGLLEVHQLDSGLLDGALVGSLSVDLDGGLTGDCTK